MTFIFQKLSQDNAEIIADEWKYDGIYSFYDMTADPEDYEEFTEEALRNKNDCYEALVNGELAGYFCVFQEGSSIEIGLGLRPDLCGCGLGKEFLRQILDFLHAHYPFSKLIVNVASFNQRATKVYRSCGFQDDRVADRETNGGTYEFLTMVKPREI